MAFRPSPAAPLRHGIGIGRRLFYSHLLTGVLVSVLVGGYLLHAARSEILRSQRQQELGTMALLAAAVTGPSAAHATERLESLRQATPEVVGLALLDCTRETCEVAARVGGRVDLGQPPGSLPRPGTPQPEDDGRTWLAATPIPGWILRAELARTSVDERLGEIRKTALLSFLLMAALALLVGQYLGRIARRIIQRLLTACRRIAEGKFEERIRVVSDDEFGQLAMAFNDMADRLQASLGEREVALKQTRQAQQQLERNVQERTAELARLNDMLRKEIEQRCQLEASLVEAAATDPLTRLLNRRGMLELISHVLAAMAGSPRVCAFMLMDIDHFKKINDTHGHEVGDQVLAAVGRAIKAELSHEEAAARWGGEEFLLMWPDCNPTQAEHRANRLRELIQGQRWLKDGRAVTISAGVIVVRHGDDFDRALSKADSALYEAKQQGRNRVVMAK